MDASAGNCMVTFTGCQEDSVSPGRRWNAPVLRHKDSTLLLLCMVCAWEQYALTGVAVWRRCFMPFRRAICLLTLGMVASYVAGAQALGAGAAATPAPVFAAPQSVPTQTLSTTQLATSPGTSSTTEARDGHPASTPKPADLPLPPPSEQLGDTLSARGRYLLAIRTFEQLPSTAPVENKLGVACLHMLMFDRARASFEAAIKLNPKYPEAYNNMGTLLHSQGDLSRAEKMYKKALKLKPESPSTLKNLGTLYYAERKFKKGDAAYHEALRLDPGVLERTNGHDIQANAKGQSAGEVHYHMALSYAQAGSYPMALQYLRKAISEGFHDRNRLLHEKDFGDLRTQPIFLQLVDDLKKD